jgi:hypothetical protein
MTDPVTSFSTLALAILSFVAVGISYWGIKKQTESLAKSVSADLCLKLIDRFDRSSMITARSLGATALLTQSKLDDADDVFDFFETVGLYVRRGILAIEMNEDPKSRDINPTDADVTAFLRQEINQTP